MATEDAPERDRAPRPLPYVDIPLLREERRASRARRGAMVALVALVAVGAATTAWVLGRGDVMGVDAGDERSRAATELPGAPTENGGDDARGNSDEGAPAPTAADDDPVVAATTVPPDAGEIVPAPAPANGRTKTPFGNARSFRHGLLAAGLSKDEATAVETALTGVMDFRRCRPVDELVVDRDAYGALTSLEYHAEPTEYFEASRGARGLVGRRVRVPVDVARLSRGGVVDTSLGDALASLGLGRALVGTFVEVFDGAIQFASDTRAGDTFRIVVDEERIAGEFLRYGAVHALEYVSERRGRLRAFYFEPRPGEGDYFDEAGRSIHGGWLRAPLRYERISSRFDPRRLHPILRRVVPHNGVDYGAGTGTPVWAAASGRVTFAGMKGPSGNLVLLAHPGGYETAYAHLHRIERGIRPGVEVRQRQVVGYVGTTGRSTGPHLHFGLRRNGRWIDPQEALNGPGRMMQATALPRYRRAVRERIAELGRITLPTRLIASSHAAHGHPDEPEAPLD